VLGQARWAVVPDPPAGGAVAGRVAAIAGEVELHAVRSPVAHRRRHHADSALASARAGADHRPGARAGLPAAPADLHRRLPAARLGTAVADCCGIRNSPPGSADAALEARLNGLAAGTVAGALAGGSLVEVLGPRLVPTLARPEDLGLLTVGALPAEERALTDLVGPVTANELAAAGIGLADAVRQLTETARAELATGPRTRAATSAPR
jgi:hypothetical protein